MYKRQLRGVETPQQVQATSDRSRISTKAILTVAAITVRRHSDQMSQSFIFRAEWSKLRHDPLLSAQFRASFDLQLHRIVPQLHFENDQYQLIYKLDILDQLRTFKLFHSRHVPFATNFGTFQLNHASTSQLVNEQNGDTYNIPKGLLSQCEVNPDALYCDKDVLHMGQDPCISAIRFSIPRPDSNAMPPQCNKEKEHIGEVV